MVQKLMSGEAKVYSVTKSKYRFVPKKVSHFVLDGGGADI